MLPRIISFEVQGAFKTDPRDLEELEYDGGHPEACGCDRAGHESERSP